MARTPANGAVPAQLKRAHRAFLSAESVATVRAHRRNALIRAAVKQGVPQVKIARELELGKARVGQIVHGA